MSEPKFCEDCKHSIRMPWHGYGLLFCSHEKLPNSSTHLSIADAERGYWFGECGRKGKLWEAKP